MHARQLACIGAAAFVGSLLVTATATTAKSQRPVVIEKHIDPMTRYVSYADLSLATHEGKKVLYKRVGQAVKEVCPLSLPPEQTDGDSIYDHIYCQQFAWQGARPQIRSAIRAAEVGTPLIMTLGVTGAQK